jgi:hypothetical protein
MIRGRAMWECLSNEGGERGPGVQYTTVAGQGQGKTRRRPDCFVLSARSLLDIGGEKVSDIDSPLFCLAAKGIEQLWAEFVNETTRFRSIELT